MSKSADDEAPQTVFIMMPFDPAYDDVYSAIKDSVVTVDSSMEVVRLDEIRSAGSITEDMIAEMRRSTLCVADVTTSNPNVMWEVGFAAALGKPVVAISQSTDGLPFDIKDIRILKYRRDSLSKTLQPSLTRAIRETLERYITRRRGLTSEQQTPRQRTIAVTGSMTAPHPRITERIERLLKPYVGSGYHWYIGSFGDTDEAVLDYLLAAGEASVATVGHHSFDISENILATLESHPQVAFIDAEQEQIPISQGTPSKRDTLLASRADLVILIWDKQSHGTGNLKDWLSSIGKDHITGFI